MKRYVLAFLVLLLAAVPSNAQLQKGDFVAICGDSITEQKLYSVYVENYLLMCKPTADVRVMQFGWSGEVAPGFLNKMPNEALKFPFNVATTAYGMNDGGYSPMDPAKADRYRNAMQGIVDKFKAHGVRFIVVGSPGCVDPDTFLRPDPTDPEPDARKKRKVSQAEMYNKTLAALRDIAKEIAEKNNATFANVFDTMLDATLKAKVKYGPKYHVPGADGFHPSPNGQLCMAYAFLKALGVDGNIGTITVDLAANKADATDGHKVLAANNGSVEIESTKYPYCFFGDPTSPSATSGIIEFLPFNQDLNRYTLIVKGTTARTKITWGKNSKEFAAADLEGGINLAAEFIADNPFSEPFQKVEAAIRAQQNAETPLVKKTLHDLSTLPATAAKLASDPAKAADKAKAEARATELTEQLPGETAKAKALFDTAAELAKQPVKHTIKIEPVK